MDEAMIRKRAENLWRALDQDVNFFRDFGVDIITNELRTAYADGQRAEQKRMSKYVNMRLTQSKTLLQAEIVAGNTVKQGHERAAIAELHGVLQQIRQAAGEVK